MADLTIYQKMLSEFMKWQDSSDDEYVRLWDLINSKKAVYKDAQKYSKLVADKWSQLLNKYFGIDAEAWCKSLIKANVRGIDRIVPVGQAMNIDVINIHLLFCHSNDVQF